MKVIMTPAKPEIITKWNLECNGQVIGKLEFDETRGGSSWHILIDAPAAEGNGLYQGHGATVELAMQQLLERHEKYATNQILRFEELRKLQF